MLYNENFEGWTEGYFDDDLEFVEESFSLKDIKSIQRFGSRDLFSRKTPATYYRIRSEREPIVVKFGNYYCCTRIDYGNGTVRERVKLCKVREPDRDNVERYKEICRIRACQRDSHSVYNIRSAQSSLRRAWNKLRDIIECNSFDFFVTLTFNNDKQDRLDDDQVRARFKLWSSNFVRKFPDAYYVGVPEYHKKGGIHYHLLVGGVSFEDFEFYDTGERDSEGRTMYATPKWDPIGRNRTTLIESEEKCASYLMKYLTKGNYDIRFKNKHRYVYGGTISRPSESKMKIPFLVVGYADLCRDRFIHFAKHNVCYAVFEYTDVKTGEYDERFIINDYGVLLQNFSGVAG